MAYWEQDGKYLQRGVMFDEIKICQNLIGATKIFFTARRWLSLQLLRVRIPNLPDNSPHSSIPESQFGYWVECEVIERSSHAATV